MKWPAHKQTGCGEAVALRALRVLRALRALREVRVLRAVRAVREVREVREACTWRLMMASSCVGTERS